MCSCCGGDCMPGAVGGRRVLCAAAITHSRRTRGWSGLPATSRRHCHTGLPGPVRAGPDRFVGGPPMTESRPGLKRPRRGLYMSRTDDDDDDQRRSRPASPVSAAASPGERPAAGAAPFFQQKPPRITTRKYSATRSMICQAVYTDTSPR